MYKHLFFLLLVTIFSVGCQEESASQNETNTSRDNDYIITDSNACLENDINWGKVTDTWSTTNGQFSEDGTLWVRSQISIEPTSVSAYYYKPGTFSDNDYVNMGRYTIDLSNSEVLEFDLMVNSNYLGTSSFVYLLVRDDCYRVQLPSTNEENISTELVRVQTF